MTKKTKSKQTVLGLSPSDWGKFFIAAGVGDNDKAPARSDRSREIRFGNFLSRFVGRKVLISVKGQTGEATLRMMKGRSKRKYYHFEVKWDEGQAAVKKAPSTTPKTGGKGESRAK